MLGATVENTCFCMFPLFSAENGEVFSKNRSMGRDNADFQNSANGRIIGRCGSFTQFYPVFGLSADR